MKTQPKQGLTKTEAVPVPRAPRTPGGPTAEIGRALRLGAPLAVLWLYRPLRLRAYAGAALSTINAAVAAISSAHSIAGQPFDRAWIRDDIKGIRRETACAKRKAHPLVATDLQTTLSGFRGHRGARDRLLYALGFAAALRRSQLVGLDWQVHGEGTGFIVLDDGDPDITLLSSKTGKGELERIVISCADMPTACNALADWIARAGFQPGAPLFRSVDKGGEISTDRLSDRSVSRIIKKDVRARAIATRRSEADADQLAELWPMCRRRRRVASNFYPFLF